MYVTWPKGYVLKIPIFLSQICSCSWISVGTVEIHVLHLNLSYPSPVFCHFWKQRNSLQSRYVYCKRTQLKNLSPKICNLSQKVSQNTWRWLNKKWLKPSNMLEGKICRFSTTIIENTDFVTFTRSESFSCWNWYHKATAPINSPFYHLSHVMT